MAETAGSKGDGKYLNLLTSSVTTAINEGDLCELDSSGNVIKCSAAATIKFIGVATMTVAARTAASQEPITIQTRGIVYGNLLKDTSGYTTSIVPGERLIVGGDAANNYDGQCFVHAPTAAGTTTDFNTDGRQVVGIALEAVGTGSVTPTVGKILLTL